MAGGRKDRHTGPVGHLGEDVHVATEIERGGRRRRDPCLACLEERLRRAVHERGAAAEQRRPSADDAPRTHIRVLRGRGRTPAPLRDRPVMIDVCHIASCQGRASASTIEPSSRRRGTACVRKWRGPVLARSEAPQIPRPARKPDAPPRHEPRGTPGSAQRAHQPRARPMGSRSRSRCPGSPLRCWRGRRRRGSGLQPCRCRRRPRAGRRIHQVAADGRTPSLGPRTMPSTGWRPSPSRERA